MAANTARASRRGTTAAGTNAQKRKSPNGNGGARKTNPDLAEATSREVEALESPAVETASGSARPTSPARAAGRSSGREIRSGGSRDGGSSKAARASGDDAVSEQQSAPPAEAGSTEPGSTGPGSAGKAVAGGVLARVAAVGEYGATLTEYGRDGLAKAGAAVRQGASAVGQVAADSAARSRDIAARGWDAYPLAFCGAALAVGIVAGLLLPSTKVEDTLMGKAADRVNGRVRKAATGLADKSKDLAGKAIGEAKAVAAAAAGDEGLTPTAIGQKAKRVAGRVKQAVAAAVEVS
jgi:hypothetical protein